MKPETIKVLMIEDNPQFSTLIQKILSREKQFSFIVTCVKKLQEGLDIIDKNGEKEIDLILLDLSLPDSEGLRSFTELFEKSPTVPIIILTGYDDETFAREAVRKGAQDYLVKEQLDIHALSRSILYAIERKRTEEKIREANLELKKLNQFKSSLMSIVSHELRTPLSSIKAAIDILLDGIDGPINKEQETSLTIARKNVDLLVRLVGDVLDYSRVEVGKMLISFQKTNIRDLMKEVYDLMKYSSEKKNLHLAIDLPSKEIIAICDENKIRQVLINLIDNAIKFSEDDGHIVARLLHSKEEVCIEIEDEGVGIKEEDQNFVFEMFGQAQKPTKKGGFGIGLAVCKQFIELHNGEISLISSPGKGTKFVVKWPLAPKFPSGAKHSECSHAPSITTLSDHKVLQ